MNKSLCTDTLLLPKEVAQRLKVSKRTIHYWIENRLITHVALPTGTRKSMYRLWESDVKSIEGCKVS